MVLITSSPTRSHAPATRPVGQAAWERVVLVGSAHPTGILSKERVNVFMLFFVALNLNRPVMAKYQSSSNISRLIVNLLLINPSYANKEE